MSEAVFGDWAPRVDAIVKEANLRADEQELPCGCLVKGTKIIADRRCSEHARPWLMPVPERPFWHDDCLPTEGPR